MDHELTKAIQHWIETPADEKDYAQGALYLLQLSGNQIMYRNISADPASKADHILYQLQKYLDFRVKELTHDEVSDMQAQADVIVEKHLSVEEQNPASEFKKGKREDHDTLPADIQQLYIDNLGIVQKMRDIQTQLRMLSTENSTCPDSERFPFLKELISLDKTMHSNWDKYDHFDEESTGTDPAEISKNALRYCNLQRSRYEKKPTEDLKLKLQNEFSKIVNPPESLANKLKDLGII